MNEDVFNMSLRKFLKKVGITSQIEIENAVREAAQAGKLRETSSLEARIVLEVPGVGLKHVIEHDLMLR